MPRPFFRTATGRAACCAILLCMPALAGELVYTPKNPTFGGSPLNGSVLLGKAQAQNRFKETAPTKSQLEQFSETLQRSILNRIASTLSSSVIDSQGNLIPGHLETDDFSITIEDIGDGQLRVTTVDKNSGQTTTFEVGGFGD